MMKDIKGFEGLYAVTEEGQVLAEQLKKVFVLVAITGNIMKRLLIESLFFLCLKS